MDAYNVGSVGAYACGKIHRRNTHAHTHASHCILARCSNRHVSSAELAAHYTFFFVYCTKLRMPSRAFTVWVDVSVRDECIDVRDECSDVRDECIDVRE